MIIRNRSSNKLLVIGALIGGFLGTAIISITLRKKSLPLLDWKSNVDFLNNFVSNINFEETQKVLYELDSIFPKKAPWFQQFFDWTSTGLHILEKYKNGE